MPQVAPDVATAEMSAIEEELRRLGYNQNSSLVSAFPPPAGPPAADPAQAQSAIAALLAGRTGGAGAGTGSPTDVATLPPELPPEQQTPQVTEPEGDNFPWWLAAGAGGLLGYLLRGRGKNQPAQAAAVDAVAGTDPTGKSAVADEIARAQGLPGAAGADMPPVAALPSPTGSPDGQPNFTMVDDPVAEALASRIQEGEFTEVPRSQLGAPPAQTLLQGPGTIAPNMPESAVGAMVRERRQKQIESRPKETFKPTVVLKDEYPDLTDDEIEWAKRKAAELLEQRGKGTRAAMAYAKKYGRYGEKRVPGDPHPPQLPRARGDDVAGTTVDDMMGAVVRMIREGKAAGETGKQMRLRGGNKGSQLRKIL